VVRSKPVPPDDSAMVDEGAENGKTASSKITSLEI
jgi:hypothetical protein